MIIGYYDGDCDVYCTDCATPIVQNHGTAIHDNCDDWDRRPGCDNCGEVLDVMLTDDGRDYEMMNDPDPDPWIEAIEDFLDL